MKETAAPEKNNDPHEALRQNVKLLGRLLGDVIRGQVGETIFQKVEEIRNLAKASRLGEREKRNRLKEVLGSLSPPELLHVARAFSQFLNLANIAEQHHRVRRRRDFQLHPERAPQEGSIEALLPKLSASGISVDQILEALSQTRIELVLTAHPTEVTRRTLIQKYNHISEALENLDRGDLTPIERKELEERLKRQISSAWHTDEIRRERPTPEQEAKWGFATVEQVLWDALPRFLRELDHHLYKISGRRLPSDAVPIRFASWMGGDRDGNPFVTAEVTERILLLARWQAADLFYREVDKLRDQLSMTACNPALRERVGPGSEPYRQLLREVRDKLGDTRDWSEARLKGKETSTRSAFETTDALREPLALCFGSLVDCNMDDIARGPLLDLLRRVDCFGLYLVKLDIRQDSGRHTAALNAVTEDLGLGSYELWSEREKQTFLLREWRNRRPLISPQCGVSEQVREVFDTFKMLAKLPREAFGSYVISMAGQPSDVLAVALLQKEFGIQKPLPIVPLFETLDDLEGAPACMENLLGLDSYYAAINGRQQVMIGYSDSAKDAGFMAASWALYQAQEKLAEVCRAKKVVLTLFHGRGGSTSRGGGPAREAILSQPPGSVNGSIRITEQGEMIRFKFGTPGIALRTMELYTSAVLEAGLLPENHPRPRPEWRAMMDRLAKTALLHFRGIVREDPRFIQYFHNCTPQGELQKLMIGSRPSRRGGGGGVENLRAIPWVFAWTQMRLMLPAWLGSGEALRQAFEQGQTDLLREMDRHWPFFKTLMDMQEMVLAKADPDIAAFYEERLAGPGLQNLGSSLRANLQRVTQAIKSLRGQKELLENHPMIGRSIRVRNPYIDPLNVLQAELMYRARRNPADITPEIEHALMVIIAGIAAGMRNTG